MDDADDAKEANDAIHVERRDPEETFTLLGSDLRVAILRALAEADGGDEGDDAVSFSELRARVGERDSGKFNYHLAKLTGQFVRRGDDGYELTRAGRQIVGAMLAGSYTTNATVDPVEIDDPCPACGARPLVVEYTDEQAHVYCRECDDWWNQFGFPPGTLDQFERDELPRAFDRWVVVVFDRIIAGFCENCAGRIEGALELEPDGSDVARVTYHCERCHSDSYATADFLLFRHPATLGFLYDHGIDPQGLTFWQFMAAVDAETVVVSDDPPAVDVTLTVDGDELVARIDGDGRVASVTTTK